MHSALAQDLLTHIRAAGQLSAEALGSLAIWLTDPNLEQFVPSIRTLVEQEDWAELEDAFYKDIPIGTGGIRGKLGPGPNRINMFTIGRAAQALCQFIEARGEKAKEGGVVIGHEARLNSREFAIMCADVLAANRIPSYLFDGVRLTPEISFAVRHLNATAGIQITASHNPKTDNGFKFYWSYAGYDANHPGHRYGGQVVPPLDDEFMGLVRNVRQIPRLVDASLRAAFVRDVPDEVDTSYLASVGQLSMVPSRSARLVFGAIHGAGSTNVLPVLERAGFEVLPVEEQLEPNGNFPHAAGKLINPEYREVVQIARDYARDVDADIAVCSDPDADRAGVVARRDIGNPDSLELLRGDDVGAALTHFVLEQRHIHGIATPDDLVLETLVTTSLVGDVARDFGVECIDNLLVGFKWMAQILQQREDAGKVGFFFATEESIGYLAGNFVRDKDASIASLLVAELASHLKDTGRTVWTYLDELYVKYGCYKNLQYLIELPGKAGMQVMQEVMLGLRAAGESMRIETLGGQRVVNYVDRLEPELRTRDRYALGKAADIITFWLSDDGKNRVTLRPSGTEPKLKYYVQLYDRDIQDLSQVKSRLDNCAREVCRDIAYWSERVLGAGLEQLVRQELVEEWRRGESRFV